MPEDKQLPRREESTRSREKNYSDLECLELIRAVKNYAHIIECKTLGNNKFYKNEDRTAAWDAVCQQFNMKTSQNRTVSSLKMKWKNDKSNIRDYVQYLKTSQSRSGRKPEEIPKPKFMNLIAEVIGVDCPALGPVPDIDGITADDFDHTAPIFKQEPHTDLSFEEIMVNENPELNYTVEDTSSMDSFNADTAQNHKLPLLPAKRQRLSNQVPPTLQSNGVSATTNRSSELQELQVQLLKKQIEVQELMAAELKAKIQRTQQLMQMEAAESELRCKEITKRLES